MTPIATEIEYIESTLPMKKEGEPTRVVFTNVSLDDLFVAMQTNEADRELARKWIANHPV
jgi:hypothetical protein